MPDSTWTRLVEKTTEQVFVQELINGFELAPRTAQGILDSAKTLLLPNTSSLRTGQIMVIATLATARHGRRMADLDKQEITLTVDAGPEDLAVLRDHGVAALRRFRILRMTEDAFDQGCLLTEEDLAWLLHSSDRTVRRDVQTLRHDGFVVRTRGYHLNIGRGQTHKVLIVENYLKRKSPLEVARLTKHSLQAVQRYISTFGRVVYLHRHQTPSAEIAFLVGLSPATVQQYLDLYATYNQPDYQQRLDEIVAPPTAQAYLPMGKKGALR